MSLSELKSLIHNLVDKSDNKYFLEAIYDFFSFSDPRAGEVIWKNLSDKQKELILKAFRESESKDNLMEHSEVVKSIKSSL